MDVVMRWKLPPMTVNVNLNDNSGGLIADPVRPIHFPSYRREARRISMAKDATVRWQHRTRPSIIRPRAWSIFSLTGIGLHETAV